MNIKEEIILNCARTSTKINRNQRYSNAYKDRSNK